MEKNAVLDGARGLINLAMVSKLVKLVDSGVYRTNDYMEHGCLRKYQSVDWFVDIGRRVGVNGKLDAYMMFSALENYTNNYTNNYVILIVRDDMRTRDTNFVIGLGDQGVGTVISTHKFESLEEKIRYNCIKTATMHELGHAFGLIPDERTEKWRTP